MRGAARRGPRPVGGACARAVVAATAIAILALATAARAQGPGEEPIGEPGPACQEATGQEVGCDTELTPVPQQATEVWTAFGGAEFGKGGELIAPQAPATVDFYTVRFQTIELGFAGGAACPEDTPFEELHDDYCGPSRGEGVPRVPVIYRYLDPDGEAGELVGAWEEYYRGTTQGYVGSIAFLSPAGTDAIAVGGSGNYPRRELGRCEVGETTATDPDYCEGKPPTGETDDEYAARDLAGEEPNAAGSARVWTYRSDRWREQTELPDTPQGDPMRGLTAVDCSTRLQDGRRCLAGAYRQLWFWQGDQFTKAFTDESPASEVDYPERFRFRVKAIRFTPGDNTPPAGFRQAIAATSGCCADNLSRNHPSILDVRPDFASMVVREQTRIGPAIEGVPQKVPVPEEAEAEKKHPADSWYSICMNCGFTESLIASPGGPEPKPAAPGLPTVPEAPSRIARQASPPGGTGVYDNGKVVFPYSLGLRLVAGDGNAGGSPLFYNAAPRPEEVDGTLDWAVGERTSTGQAIAYTTRVGPTPLVDALQCPPEVNTSLIATDGSQVTALQACQPSQEGAVAGTRSKRAFELPTYALNAFAFTKGTSTAWAAGDRGALWRLGGQGGAGEGGGELEPPRLGARQPGQLSDTTAYDGLGRGGSGPPGAVPALDGHDEQRLDQPRLLPSGVPDPTSRGPREDVDQIVMSRDGSEGWAIGTAASDRATTLFHYAGGHWSRCETDGAPGVIEADPACEALAALRRPSGGGAPIGIQVAARIPLERDADPSNDDEFELMAITTNVGSSRVALRYRAGRWSIDDAATKGLNISVNDLGLAFTAPDDGWLVTGWQFASVYHFDGQTWTQCTDANREACGDPNKLLPLPNVVPAAPQVTMGSAGGRVYLAGARFPSAQPFVGATTKYPMIIYKDRDGDWSNDPGGGGYDPGCAPNPAGPGCLDSGKQEEQGAVAEISVAPSPGGGYAGWASGVFGGGVAGADPSASVWGGRKLLGGAARLLRLEPDPGDGPAWSPWTAGERAPGDPLADPGDASEDYLPSAQNPQLLAIPGAVGDADAWIVPRANAFPGAPMLEFREGRWRASSAPFSMTYSSSAGGASQWEAATALPQAAAPDGRGGFWLAARQAGSAIGKYNEQVAFYHYTDRAPKPVFTEAPHPIRETITAAAGGPDGSFWVATASSAVYRYDRVTGWDRVRVPGWDPGRTVTRPSEATAIAIGAGGEGVVVGEGGRIAELAPSVTQLDAAAGAALCEAGASGPCGTGHTLRAAAIAPTGEALVGGDRRALLWRSGEGEFHSIPPPPATADATITGIAYPQANQAFLTTDLGQVWAGNPAVGDWHIENRDPESGLLESVNTSGTPLELRAIAVDGSGHGYAVGEGGAVLERTGNPAEPWRRLDEGLRDDFYSVALPAGGGGGALLGGANGVVYTLDHGRFEVARPADPWDPLTTAPVTNPRTARIVGLAMLAGSDSGETEAWAASAIPPGLGRNPAPSAVLHYTSEPGDPMVNPGSQAEALPDTPDAPGALTLAAFGRSECQVEGAERCPEPQDSNMASDSVVRRVTEEIAELRRSSDEPVLGAFTGDVALGAGPGGSESTPADTNVQHRRWAELVAPRFAEEGVPLFGAIGTGDLSQTRYCVAGCKSTQQAGVGTSGPWRDAMAGMPAPWGRGGAPSEDGVSYVPVEAGALADAPGGGARTHYALDVVRGGEKLLRLVFADNSMRSLAASEPNQSQVEQGGQDSWLDQVLCRQGGGAGCTRGPAEPAAVVANVPTYSYGPGALEHTATDAATFEQTLLERRVSALITGRLGWNGLYYTCAPQLHTPRPGGEYPAEAPQGVADCVGGEDTGELPVEPPDPNELLGELGGTRILPSVIAASAGGRFGPNRDDQGSAADGYWHGYTVIRIPADGDQSKVIVEQRPVFDWVSIRPAPGAKAARMVRAGKKLALEGFGREVAGTDVALRYDEITTAAITHRYDLLEADPDRPWLPLEAEDNGVRSQASSRLGEEDPCGPYLCLSSKIGTINEQSGEVRAGNGQYPRTFAIAALSAGHQSATYPLVFEPRASYRVQPPAPAVPVAVPPPPPPPAPVQPTSPTVNLPAAPVLPVLTAQALAPPPLPPAPPTFASEAPLDLNLSPAALDVTPPTAVSQPPTPPVNPAPPGGARKEARQRQAAAQKSGADSAQEDGETQNLGGDLAEGREGAHGSDMTRHEFAAIANHEQPSAWARDALLGGGLGAAALILALGLGTARPTPRRRAPEVPAPAFARARRRDHRS